MAYVYLRDYVHNMPSLYLPLFTVLFIGTKATNVGLVKGNQKNLI